MDRPAETARRQSLARATKRSVRTDVRERGYARFAAGAVVAMAVDGPQITATVQGSRRYRVTLTKDIEAYTCACTCPFFVDGNEVCKHVWAVVLAADRDGLIPPDRPEMWLDPESPDDDFDDLGPFALDFPALQPAPLPVRRTPEPWEQFLTEIAQTTLAAEAARRPPKYLGGEFIYIIDKAGTQQGPGVLAMMMWRQRKKNGEWGKPQPALVTPTEIEQYPEAIDREIVATLIGASELPGAGYSPFYGRATFRLQGPIVDRALWQMASSRRLYLREASYPSEQLRPVSADTGPPWVFRLETRPGEDGGVQLSGSLSRDGERMELAEPQLLLESGHLLARGSLARLDHGGAFAWLRQLRRTGAPSFPPGVTGDLVGAIARTQVHPAVLPAELKYDVVDLEPRPRVRVERARRGYGSDELIAFVEFDYGGIVVPARVAASAYDPAHRRLIRRNPDVEHSAIERLHQLGFRRGPVYDVPEADLEVAPSQFTRAVRTLLAEGWHVEADGTVFRTARHLHVHVKSGIDWFELHGDLDFGDGRSAPLTEMLAAVKRGDHTIVLGDGTRGMVPEEWLRRYARVAGFGEVEEGHVRFKPNQTALLDALLESQPSVDVDEAFARARDEIRSFGGIELPAVPSSFAGTLREYQHEALGWFAFLRRFGFGGCLADDMGLGKTVMVLALLDGRRQDAAVPHRPSLAVVPKSLVFNWVAEARRFAPQLRVLDYTGADRTQARIADYDLVLTTYGTLRRDVERLNEQEFDYLILDEAQAIKNAATASAKAVRLLRGRHRLALSGTPVENHIGELWSIFEFLNPGLLGSSAAFRRGSSVQSRTGGEDLALVARALKPLILRRTKEQVAPELPSRTEQTIYCELDEGQRRFYDGLRSFYRSSLLARVERDGLNRSKMHVLEALLRLRQAACHSGLVEAKHLAQPSAKFDLLVPQLMEVIGEGHKALVFSQFTQLLGLLKPRLDREKIVYEYLDGKTRDRAARVERFSSDPDCRVFLISLKAGGLGLNLTAAEYVFLLDPWWNPAAEAQAIDRAHRIGQSRHVFAYRLIARDTVEEKVAELQASKRELADAILTADPALIRNLRTEDLDLLLS